MAQSLYHEACEKQFLISLPATGTGLKIPPAAQQALQMTGSIPFGNIAAPAGEGLEDLKHVFFILLENSVTNHYSLLFQLFQLQLQAKP